ncbi:Cyclin family protein [Rhynchospora pubera]|uniref:Cyclin family protein n=1 Tax=Rhynchospora pubera TaxID=906938 RepID=A0AAV8CMV6_9POAL|nr:Cyclin family protein [Rhynchospora pubera]
MASSNNRPSISVSSAPGKRAASESAPTKAPAITGKKRVALGDLSNVTNAACGTARAPPKTVTKTNPPISSIVKRRPATTNHSLRIRHTSSHCAPTIINPISKPTISTSSNTTVPTDDVSVQLLLPAISVPPVPCHSDHSPERSRGSETVSMCDSIKNLDFEYVENANLSTVASLERKTNTNLRISDNIIIPFSKWNGDASCVMEIDNDADDPQICAPLASDIYKHLRIAEAKKMPAHDFLETIQTDITPNMRAILIDWLVEVAEEYRLVPDTLYLTVNYIDRYLSGNAISRQRLQLLGVACMFIASKYEEICAPQVEEFCYITDNTYFKDEALQMEASVLNFLKFEITSPTAKCFLRRFIRAAQLCDEDSSMPLEFLASYIAELSLLEYNLLCYSPSFVAAASIFLAKFILHPTRNPWSATLSHYTLYKPSELRECVNVLHRLFCDGSGSSLPAIKEKYSQHKYKFASKKHCPSVIPSDFFKDVVQ